MITIRRGVTAASGNEEVRRQRVSTAIQEARQRKLEHSEKNRTQREAIERALEQEAAEAEKPILTTPLFQWVRWTFEDTQAFQSKAKVRTAATGETIEDLEFPGIAYGVPNVTTPEGWEEDVRRKVLAILLSAIDPFRANPKELEQSYDMVGQEIYWNAFTHSYWNPNEGHNYELDEKIGDSTAKTALITILVNSEYRYTLGEHELTIAVNTILSKPEQARVSDKLGLPPLLRSTLITPSGINISEDLFESFFGATYTFAEQIGYGGQQVCNQLMFYLIQAGYILLPEGYFETDAKSEVTSVFSRLGLGKAQSDVRLHTIGHQTLYQATIGIKLDDQTRAAALRALPIIDIYEAVQHRRKPRPVPQPPLANLVHGSDQAIIATGQGMSKVAALNDAWGRAQRAFRDYGFIREVTHLEHLKISQIFYPSIATEFYAAYDLARSQGYDNIVVGDAERLGDYYYIVLYGIRIPGDDLLQATKYTIYQVTIPSAVYERANEKEHNEGNKKKGKITRTQTMSLVFKLYAKSGGPIPVSRERSNNREETMSEEEQEEEPELEQESESESESSVSEDEDYE